MVRIDKTQTSIWSGAAGEGLCESEGERGCSSGSRESSRGQA